MKGNDGIGVTGVGRRVSTALALWLALAAPVRALEPPPLCSGVAESGMEIVTPAPLGEGGSGVVVEGYVDARIWRGRGANVRTPPSALEDFNGMRVVHCASGRFLTLDEVAFDIPTSLAATEFIRPKLKAGRAVSYNDVRRAVDALYPGATAYRETAETCSCNAAYPEMRPSGMIPFAERSDIDR